MAWVIFSKFVESLLDGSTSVNLDTGGDTLQLAFLDATLAPDPTHDGDEFWDDIVVNEVTGTGYTTGGQTLDSQLVSMADGTLTFDVADEVFSQNAAGFSDARYAILWKDTTVDSTSPLIAYADLGGDKSVVSGDLTIEMDAAGVFTVGLAT